LHIAAFGDIPGEAHRLRAHEALQLTKRFSPRGALESFSFREGEPRRLGWMKLKEASSPMSFAR
jgi:hypothetical protein